MDPLAQIASDVDPDGRRVVLDAAAWSHIVQSHPEVEQHATAVMATVRQPDHRQSDPRPGRERYYRRAVGPSRWCLVVVDFNAQQGRIVTAFGVRHDPEGWRQ